MKTNLFKFMALRAPDTAAMESRAEAMVRDDRPFSGTPVGKILAKATPTNTEFVVLSEVREFLVKGGYALNKREPLLQQLEDFFARHRRSFDSSTFEVELKALLGATSTEFSGSKEFARILSQSWDKLYAFFLLKRVRPLNLEGLLRDLRLLNLLKALGTARAIPSAEVLAAYADHSMVITPQLTNLGPGQGKEPSVTKPSKEVLQRYAALWREFGDLYLSQKELRMLKWEQRTLTTNSKPDSPKNNKNGASKKLSTKTQSYQLFVPDKELARLSSSTRQWLTKSRVLEDAANPSVLSDRLNAELSTLYARVTAIRDPDFYALMPRTEEWPRSLEALRQFYTHSVGGEHVRI